MKRFAAFVAILIVSGAAFIAAEKFRIADVSYSITGKTRQYALEQAVTISKTRIFNSYDELHTYIADLEQQFNNERVLASATVNVRYSAETDENGIQNIYVTVSTTDSHHFLALPYLKYDSNDGLITKLKTKDTNFLGTMSTLNFDLNFSLEQDDVDQPVSYVFGTNFDYDYPFKAGPFNATWNNTDTISYTLGDSSPEFSLETGITLELPLDDDFSFKMQFTQDATHDYDYEKYDDAMYYTEAVKLSLPVRLTTIDNWGKVLWTPYVSYSRNWDPNGISNDNSDLASPVTKAGHAFSTSRVNWYGNFREGMTVSADQSFGYNEQTDKFIPEVSGEFIGYKAYKYAGLTTDLYAFVSLNGSEKIGSRLRGIRDDQYYADNDDYALKVPAALCANFDMPIHIFTTDWIGLESFLFGADSRVSKAFSFMKYFDFELQASPFFDMALTKNEVTGRLFSYKDGFYSGGLEVIVYPAKWRSLMVRTSVGIDAGRKIIAKYVPSLIDTSWRSNVSAYEIYFGIGLAY